MESFKSLLQASGSLGAFCLAFGTGSAGYFIFRLLRVPNPALLGSMAATGALNIAGLYPAFNSSGVLFLANMTIGVLLGRHIGRDVFRHIRSLALPVLIQVAWILATSLVCGCVMRLLSDVSLSTALISGAAGGITEMLIFGMSVDANVAVIACVQLCRVVVFLTLLPYLAVIIGKITGKAPPKKASAAERRNQLPPFSGKEKRLLWNLAFAGAVIGVMLKIPTGAMLGAMFACGSCAVWLGKCYTCDDRLRRAAQIVLGLGIGQRMTPQIVAQLQKLLLPAIIVTVVMLVSCTLLALILNKFTGMELTTALLCSAPAGLSQIASFAEELGVDPFTAAVFHTARIVSIVSLYPLIILPLTAG